MHILSLAHSLNLVVTAEGVERQGQLDWLLARGCHEVQGFRWAAASSVADLEGSRFFSYSAPSVIQQELAARSWRPRYRSRSETFVIRKR